MEITKAEQNGLSHSFSITIPAAEIDASIEAELLNVGESAKIDGFRPGKIPMNVLKQQFSKRVLGDVIDKAVNKAAKEVFEQKELKPAVRPDIKIESYEEGQDLVLSMQVEQMPDVPEFDLSTVSVEKYVYEITDSEVEQGIERLAAQQKDFVAKAEGEAAAQGDAVKIDFIGRIEGEAFEGGTADGVQLELGAGQFIPGFEEQLVGKKAGDKVDVAVSFPENYHKEDLAGKPAVFETTVHEVLVASVPSEYDDTFAARVGFETIAELREKIKEHLETDYAAIARSRSKKKLFDAMDGVIDFETPEGVVKQEYDIIMQQYEQAKEAGRVSPKDLEKGDVAIAEEYKEVARRRVKLGFVLANISEKEGLQVTQEELSQAVMAEARNYPGQEQKVLEFYQQNPEQVEQIRGPLIEEKAVDYLLEKVQRKEVTVTTQALASEEEDIAA